MVPIVLLSNAIKVIEFQRKQVSVQTFWPLIAVKDTSYYAKRLLKETVQVMLGQLCEENPKFLVGNHSTVINSSI